MKKISFGIILLTVALFSIISCKKEKTPEPVAPAPVATALSSTTQEYIKFTIGTTDYSLTKPSSGLWSSGSFNIFQTGSLPNYYSTDKTYDPAPGFYLCIQDSTTETSTPLSSAYFRSFLSVKDYSFLPYYNYPPKHAGVILHLKDNSNVNWSTYNQTNPNFIQQGSIFKIIETVEYSPSSTLVNIKFKAIFNCKLYNTSGDSTMLTNGEMITYFSNH